MVTINLEKVEIDNIINRQRLLNQKILEITALQREYELYFKELFEKYKLEGDWKLTPDYMLEKIEKKNE